MLYRTAESLSPSLLKDKTSKKKKKEQVNNNNNKTSAR